MSKIDDLRLPPQWAEEAYQKATEEATTSASPPEPPDVDVTPETPQQGDDVFGDDLKPSKSGDRLSTGDGERFSTSHGFLDKIGMY